MEELVKVFLESNKGKPKIIIMGEHHGGNNDLEELFENVGKEITIVKTVHSMNKPFVIYTEAPEALVHLFTKKFTGYFLKAEAERLNVPFLTSKITYECRANKGSCDDLYAPNIISHLNTEVAGAVGAGAGTNAGNEQKIETVVCAIGLLHAADMVFPKEISVLRLNCSTKRNTNFAITELKKYRKNNTAERITSLLPYIQDSNSFFQGMKTVLDSSRKSNINNGSNTNNESNTNTTSDTFEPIWLKNNYGDWVIQCPVCKSTSGSLLTLQHRYNCPNKNKKADLSKKPSMGGNRKRKTIKRKRKTKKYRQTLKVK